ncbi:MULTISPECIES: hypothetical protein [unclassified Streptomyces]|uniref:hypothetical protein n=1 Tax=unclassified Streptomyces TaxID=2593676 RepID=UPI0033FBEDFA
MDPYISHSPWRREDWKGHATKKAVRQAIAYDRGRDRLSIFVLDHTPAGPVYELAPREQWDALFTD